VSTNSTDSAHLPIGAPVPKLVGLDAQERLVDVADWWVDAPVVAIFLRHFG